ncbi:hypothetical protein [Halegenticoccus tardaugens]|uniref:hypothetical protein n=1 Tax=Halegenticoccus tardaugens TaxID=2071624 RepID=UPI00100B0ADF|nr:hypothetical protein [Halegenticoccus tardaugens]
MYDAAFGTEWTALDRTEAIERAFALGVSAACGEPDPDEYERVLAAVSTAYERSMVELAFREGRGKAAGLRRRSAAPDEVWAELVEPAGTAEGSNGEADRGSRRDLPRALSRFDLLDRRGGGIEATRLPDVLTRD